MPPSEPFGKRVRAARELRGWTQAQLAERSKVPAMMISHFETGVRTGVSAATLVKLANALSVSVDYLLGRVDDPTPVGGQVGALLRSVESASADTLDDLVRIAQTLTNKDTQRRSGDASGQVSDSAQAHGPTRTDSEAT
jgi:transcriptional regulator with XRE-family HTH domain